MKSTWATSDSPRRRNLTIGFVLFVLGIGVASYCGYMERYVGQPQPDLLKFSGWMTLILGLAWHLLGILPSPIRRS